MRRAQHLPTPAHKQQEHIDRHFGMQSISLGSSRSGLAHQGRHPSFHPATQYKNMLRARCCTAHSPAAQLARLTVCSNIEEHAKRAPAAERKKVRLKAGVLELQDAGLQARLKESSGDAMPNTHTWITYYTELPLQVPITPHHLDNGY